MAHARYASGGTDPTHGQLVSGSGLMTLTAGASERRSGALDSYVIQYGHGWGSVGLRTSGGDEGTGLARTCLSCRIGGSPGRWC